MPKTNPSSIRLSEAERAALAAAAHAERRSSAALARIILAEWLQGRGWLPRETLQPAASANSEREDAGS